MAAQRQAIDRIEEIGRELAQDACYHVECKQHPEEPDRATRPRPLGDGFPPEVCEADVWMLAQLNRVVGQRNNGESTDHERQAQPDQAIVQIAQRSLARKPRQTNSPDSKKNIAMKKLSVASTIMSKPIHDFGSVCPK
jgi:hypothetical protein